jgi:hypothetical protein
MLIFSLLSTYYEYIILQMYAQQFSFVNFNIKVNVHIIKLIDRNFIFIRQMLYDIHLKVI